MNSLPFQASQRLTRVIKRQAREADNSPPSNAEDKNAWSYTSMYPMRLLGVVLS
jgi:hypothetical protein